MFTQDFLKQIKETIFQSYFMEGILAIHADRVSEGEYRTDIRDYKTAMATLLPTLTVEDKAMLTE